MHKLTRRSLIAAGLGGALWTIKALVITANDGSFGLLESIFFLGGLAALLTAAVLIAIDLARGLTGVPRVAATLAMAVVLVAATVALEALGKTVIGGPYDGGNLGLEEESGILLAGLVWLTVAAVAARARTGRPATALAAS